MREHSARLSLFPSPALFRPPFASLFCLVTCLFVCVQVHPSFKRSAIFWERGEHGWETRFIVFFFCLLPPGILFISVSRIFHQTSQRGFILPIGSPFPGFLKTICLTFFFFLWRRCNQKGALWNGVPLFFACVANVCFVEPPFFFVSSVV